MSEQKQSFHPGAITAAFLVFFGSGGGCCSMKGACPAPAERLACRKNHYRAAVTLVVVSGRENSTSSGATVAIAFGSGVLLLAI